MPSDIDNEFVIFLCTLSLKACSMAIQWQVELLSVYCLQLAP